MLEDVVEVNCPWCFEPTALEVNMSQHAHGSTASDCQVCCRPLSVILERRPSGDVTTHVQRGW